MAVHRYGTKTRGVSGESKLRRDLEAELRSPTAKAEPVILIEDTNPQTIHLFVVWSRWGDLEQIVRSRIIMDAFKAVKGQEEALKVTVAMGLSKEEAGRLGIKKS